MNIHEYPFNHNITTKQELSTFIGMPILFGYPNEKCCEVAWIKTITSIQLDPFYEETYDCDDIKFIRVFGLNTYMVIKNFTPNGEFLHHDSFIKESMSITQMFARTLTKEEFKKYAKITAVRRLYNQILLK